MILQTICCFFFRLWAQTALYVTLLRVSGPFLPVQVSPRFHSVLNRIRCKHRSFCFWGKSSFLVPCGSPSQSIQQDAGQINLRGKNPERCLAVGARRNPSWAGAALRALNARARPCTGAARLPWCNAVQRHHYELVAHWHPTETVGTCKLINSVFRVIYINQGGKPKSSNRNINRVQIFLCRQKSLI